MLFEIEFLRGLEDFVDAELRRALGIRMSRHRIDYRGPLAPLLSLRTVVAIHRYERFDGRRPTVLLGDQRLREMLGFALSTDSFTGFRVSSPGKDSSALHRVREAIGAWTGLPENPDGDLLIRIRRDPTGWEVLVRLTSRSLSARGWRVADLPGALHASMAAAMIELARPGKADRILNLCCGSGTLIAECRRGKLFVGVDNSAEALGAARDNLAAAGRTPRAEAATVLARANARELPLADRSADVILCDLPYGHAIGDHEDNRSLYPELLAEAARVAADGARFAACTQDIRLFETSIADDWQVEKRLRVQQQRAMPAIYLLRRAAR
ncbi:MAG: methyltransferase domain-containing protein [Microlunatus sp.]|nr:methyltransferase domain-containing protein [Microlunatus sp.]